jgi:hypothetical protein
MRTRRSFQPTLDSLPIRITPSGGMLKAAAATAITASIGTLNAAAAPAIHGGVHPEDNGNPSENLTGDGSNETILQPITVPTTLMA